MVWTDPDDFPGANQQRYGRYDLEPSRPGGKNFVGDLKLKTVEGLCGRSRSNDESHHDEEENAGFYWSDTPDPGETRRRSEAVAAAATRSGARKSTSWPARASGSAFTATRAT